MILAMAALLLPSAVFAETPFTCYARTYDKAHMAKHPGQIMQSVRIKLVKSKLNEHGITFDGEVNATVVGQPGRWSEGFSCTGKGAVLSCFIECDGGRFELRRNKDSLKLVNADRFRLAKDGCGEESLDVKATSENRVYLLKQSKPDICKGMYPE